MNRVKLSVRVPMGQEVMIRRYAEARGLTRYQALSRVIEAGLGVVADAPVADRGSAGVDAIAGFEARLGMIEALLDRSLFTASAAYPHFQPTSCLFSKIFRSMPIVRSVQILITI